MEKVTTALKMVFRRLQTPRAIPTSTPAPCMNCGARKAIFLGHRVRPDFDVATLSPGLRASFLDRMDGICVNCGIYQAYKRFTHDQLVAINNMGKDMTTSDKAFHQPVIPQDYIQAFEAKHYSKRLGRWKEFIDKKGFQPKRALFIRMWFGAGPVFLHETYGTDVSGIDMSEGCVRAAQSRFAGLKVLKGAINGMLEGDFLATGPYDAVFVFHVLIHSCDVHDSLKKIKGLLRPGGVAVFTHEIVRKPNNPFHMLHSSEAQLKMLLSKYFGSIERIDNCSDEVGPHVAPYTEKGDDADVVAWNE